MGSKLPDADAAHKLGAQPREHRHLACLFVQLAFLLKVVTLGSSREAFAHTAFAPRPPLLWMRCGLVLIEVLKQLIGDLDRYAKV